MSSEEESSRKSQTKGKLEKEKRIHSTVYDRKPSSDRLDDKDILKTTSTSLLLEPGRTLNEKRKDYLSWDDYFMATAFLAAQRSKDPCTQVGACIVSPDNKIVGVGYNGFPKGCSDDEFPWGKNSPSELERKKFYVCHAEANAILNKNASDTKNCRMYVALFPCNECAKFIIQSGITEVIYMSDKNWHKDEVKASRKMFDASGVQYKKFEPQKRQVVIDFDQIS